MVFATVPNQKPQKANHSSHNQSRDGIQALERLLARLADVATPDGGPPRERGLRALPVIPQDVG